MFGMPIVEIIEPTVQKISVGDMSASAKKKVAAYARVSTEQDEQLTSYGNQIEYYTKYIQSRADWEFVGIYSDEGVSGLSTQRRSGFNRMMNDALNGGIDLILTKSVSRFARNTLDTLDSVRKLKEKDVEVYFEKENIYTLDNKGELFLTIMATLAQEESRSISENVTWGKRRLMAQGRFSLPYANFLGYEKGEDGKPKIVEEQAMIVRRIFDMYIEGRTLRNIANTLRCEGIPTPSGKSCNWHNTTILHILQNEKYKGAALLQKTFTKDFLSKKRAINDGEIRQYRVENSHPAIIDSDIFDHVQKEIERRAGKDRGRHSDSVFDRKVICGGCGHLCSRRLWSNNAKGRVYAWYCAHKDSGCSVPAIQESDLRKAFIFSQNQRGVQSDEFDSEKFSEIVRNIILHTDGNIEINFSDGSKTIVERAKSRD